MKKKINWTKVWKSFEHWFGYHAKDYTWETQQKQIQKIIERQLKTSK